MLQESSPRPNPPPPLVGLLGVHVAGAVRGNLAPLLAAFSFAGRVQGAMNFGGGMAAYSPYLGTLYPLAPMTSR